MAKYTLTVAWETTVDAATETEALKVAEARLQSTDIDTSMFEVGEIAPSDD